MIKRSSTMWAEVKPLDLNLGRSRKIMTQLLSFRPMGSDSVRASVTTALAIRRLFRMRAATSADATSLIARARWSPSSMPLMPGFAGWSALNRPVHNPKSKIKSIAQVSTLLAAPGAACLRLFLLR